MISFPSEESLLDHKMGTARNFSKVESCRVLAYVLKFPAALGPGVYSASNRNEFQKQKNNVSGE
jgi:hypothetical protein